MKRCGFGRRFRACNLELLIYDSREGTEAHARGDLNGSQHLTPELSCWRPAFPISEPPHEKGLPEQLGHLGPTVTRREKLGTTRPINGVYSRLGEVDLGDCAPKGS